MKNSSFHEYDSSKKNRLTTCIKNISPCRRVLCVLLLLLIVGQMFFIFSNSHKNAVLSDAQSDSVVRLVTRVLLGKDLDTLPSNVQDTVTHFVRKTAHFTEFAILGMLSSLWCLTFGLLSEGESRKRAVFFVGVTAFCCIVGFLDELSQCFSDGRACRFTDVLIDTSGGLVATVVVFILHAVFQVKRSKNRSSK